MQKHLLHEANEKKQSSVLLCSEQETADDAKLGDDLPEDDYMIHV